MNLKRAAALFLALSVLCGALSGMSLTASAAEPVLSTDYEAAYRYVGDGIDGVNIYRNTDFLVKYEYGFDAQYDLDWGFEHLTSYYTGPNMTATNEFGYEVAVNAFGYVVEKEALVGAMTIPEGGYVLSGVGTKGENLYNHVELGDYIQFVGYNYYVYRVTDDSHVTDDTYAFSIKRSQLAGITVGGDGVKTGSSYWNNDVLVKIIGEGADTSLYKGYVVEFGGNDIEVPEGYFAITLAGQTAHDTGKPAQNGAQLFKEYATPGTLINCGVNEIFFRHDASSAIRAAYLLTGLTNGRSDDLAVNSVYDDSAKAILDDALTNYELVDTDRMTALYNNMAAITAYVAGVSNPTIAALEPYLATLNQNYAELCKLEYEVRTVEMRATWMRPLSPFDTAMHTAEELDAMLEEDVLRIKAQGYNMIFIEAFYNSTTIFPIPEGVGYNGLSFKQNPYLTAAYNPNLTEDYDMLQRFIDICEEHDMEPHIWWEIFYVGYERTNGATDSLFDYSVAKTIMENPDQYPYYLNTAQNGDQFYGAVTDGALQYFLNPASTGARTFLMNTFEYVWRTYDVCSFQMDYIRYPHTNSAKCFGYDADTLAAFLSRYPSYTEEQLRTSSYFWNEDWVSFRANFVTTFVENIRSVMKSIRPDMYLTASPGAEPEESRLNLMQDVSYWLTNDYIDIIFPMAYGENVPGYVSAGLVADNTHHFVCTGVSGSYLDDDMEARWAKQIRDAGADGLAAFGEIPDYADYVWSKPAVTPTGNAAKAARVYLEDTVCARADQMAKLGGIDSDELKQIKEAAAAADQIIRVNGIDSAAALSAINALQAVADTLDTNPKAALTNDVHYLLKIRSNSLDQYMQSWELSNSDSSLTVDGISLADGGEEFTYVSSTDTLYIQKDGAVLSGTLERAVTLLLADNVSSVTFDGVTIGAGDAAVLEATQAVTITLYGTNTVTASTLAEVAYTFIGTGELYNGDTLFMRKGDILADSADAVNSEDIRGMLCYQMDMLTLSQEQIATGDANGDGLLDTTDARVFLKMIAAA